MENGRERFLSIQNHEKMEEVMRSPNLTSIGHASFLSCWIWRKMKEERKEKRETESFLSSIEK